MKLSLAKKQKLQKLLGGISTDAEKKELQRLDALKVKEITQFFEDVEVENETRVEKLERGIAQMTMEWDRYRQASEKHGKYLVQTFGNFSESMIEKLGELGGTITTSYEKNKPFNAAGVYKDMLNQLSAVNENIKNKPVPVWNWPQYASVGVRDKNFANVNPSIAPFNITASYDDLQLAYDGSNNLTTVTYYSNGAVVAVLSLSYDVSNNLIQVQRTQ